MNEATKDATIELYKREVKEQQERADDNERRAAMLEKSLSDMTWERDELKYGENQRMESFDNLVAANNGLSARCDEAEQKAETAAKMLNEKDTEIMKLKAMLFDAMYKTA